MDASPRHASLSPAGPASTSIEVKTPDLQDYLPGLEAEIVRVLDLSQRHGWNSEDTWRWKYSARPGFRPEEVVTAHTDGRMVACLHTAVLPVKLEDGLEILVSFDGDFAVLPEFRRRGLLFDAYDVTDRRLLARHVSLRGGFTSPELNIRFYQKHFGMVFMPSVTTQFRKHLGLGPLRPRVKALGDALLDRPRIRAALASRPLTVDLRVEGLPDGHLVFAGDGFRLEHGAATTPDLSVRSPYILLATLADSPSSVVKVAIVSLLRGRLRVRGLLRQGPRLLGIIASVLRGRGVPRKKR